MISHFPVILTKISSRVLSKRAIWRTGKADAAVAVADAGGDHLVELTFAELLAEALHHAPQLLRIDVPVSILVEILHRAAHRNC